MSRLLFWYNILLMTTMVLAWDESSLLEMMQGIDHSNKMGVINERCVMCGQKMGDPEQVVIWASFQGEKLLIHDRCIHEKDSLTYTSGQDLILHEARSHGMYILLQNWKALHGNTLFPGMAFLDFKSQER